MALAPRSPGPGANTSPCAGCSAGSCELGEPLPPLGEDMPITGGLGENTELGDERVVGQGPSSPREGSPAQSHYTAPRSSGPPCPACKAGEEERTMRARPWGARPLRPSPGWGACSSVLQGDLAVHVTTGGPRRPHGGDTNPSPFGRGAPCPEPGPASDFFIVLVTAMGGGDCKQTPNGQQSQRRRGGTVASERCGPRSCPRAGHGRGPSGLLWFSEANVPNGCQARAAPACPAALRAQACGQRCRFAVGTRSVWLQNRVSADGVPLEVRLRADCRLPGGGPRHADAGWQAGLRVASPSGGPGDVTSPAGSVSRRKDTTAISVRRKHAGSTAALGTKCPARRGSESTAEAVTSGWGQGQLQSHCRRALGVGWGIALNSYVRRTC